MIGINDATLSSDACDDGPKKMTSAHITKLTRGLFKLFEGMRMETFLIVNVLTEHNTQVINNKKNTPNFSRKNKDTIRWSSQMTKKSIFFHGLFLETLFLVNKKITTKEIFGINFLMMGDLGYCSPDSVLRLFYLDQGMALIDE